MAEGFNCKFFSITDPQGVNTIIYRINMTPKEYLNQYPKYTVERLSSTEEQVGNYIKKTFYVAFPKKEGDDLVFLSFGSDKVVVNTGKLKDNKVKILKSPLPVQFDTIYTDEQKEKVFKYTPNLNRPITIIDPETTKEVVPMVYIDQNTNEIKGKCKLKPNKAYFTFEIRNI